MPEALTILQRVAMGDRFAVDDCIEQYGGLIWSIGKRYLRDSSDLEDVTQEVFIELWQKASRFDPCQGTEPSFVAVIARRRMMDRLRRTKAAKNSPPTHSLDEVDDIGVADIDPVVWGEEVRRTASCLEKLDSIRRKILVMNLRDGESHGKIADVLQLPLGTIKSHARRGLLQMRQCVGMQVEAIRSASVSGLGPVAASPSKSGGDLR